MQLKLNSLNLISRLLTLCMILAIVVIPAIPVSATVANPDLLDIKSNQIQAFNNVFATGDLLIMSYVICKYTTIPATPSTTNFVVNLYAEDNTTLLASKPLASYGYSVSAFYFTALEIDAINLATGNLLQLNKLLKVRICNNPLITFAITPVDTFTMSTENWNTGTLNGTTPTNIFSKIIPMAESIATDTITTLTQTSSTTGTTIINTAGKLYFTTAINGIDIVCPQAFSFNTQTLSNTFSTPTYAYQTGTVNVGQQLGSSTEEAFKGIATYMLGDPEKSQLIEASWGLLLVLLVSSIVFLGTGSTTISLLAAIPMVILATWVGAFPMVIIFLVLAVMIFYLGYHFILRGM